LFPLHFFSFSKSHFFSNMYFGFEWKWRQKLDREDKSKKKKVKKEKKGKKKSKVIQMKTQE
jgi:hypothetical protein